MNRLLVCFVVLFLAPANVLAQSKTQPPAEQSLQELVAEVRQLRATLQRMNAGVYKVQVILEQLKLRQEQVTRLSRELNDVREKLSEMQASRSKMKVLLEREEAEVEAGTRHPAETANLKNELEAIVEREQRMMVRETQLANELETERAKLNELNDKLNLLLEQDLSPR